MEKRADKSERVHKVIRVNLNIEFLCAFDFYGLTGFNNFNFKNQFQKSMAMSNFNCHFYCSLPLPLPIAYCLLPIAYCHSFIP
jgi:hypothetical protein